MIHGDHQNEQMKQILIVSCHKKRIGGSFKSCFLSKQGLTPVSFSESCFNFRRHFFLFFVTSSTTCFNCSTSLYISNSLSFFHLVLFHVLVIYLILSLFMTNPTVDGNLFSSTLRLLVIYLVLVARNGLSSARARRCYVL